jgi:hypothetical protein
LSNSSIDLVTDTIVNSHDRFLWREISKMRRGGGTY